MALCPRCLAAGPADALTLDSGDSATAIRGEASGAVSDAVASGGKIGRYVVSEILGQGGMGIIYTAYDPQLDRQIAIKLLRTAKWAGTRRL